MIEAKFILSKKKVFEQYQKLIELGVKVSYSYKTNKEVGQVLQKLCGCEDCNFSIHEISEINDIIDKKKIWFFPQAWNENEIKGIIEGGVVNFVIDNEKDLNILLEVVEKLDVKINLSLRMKFQEHRIGTGKYFVYGMASGKVNEIIFKLKNNKFIDKIGVHIHRKSQNTSEWEIKEELVDSLSENSLRRINFINLGGGLPSRYRNYTSKVLPYIFDKIREVKEWLSEYEIETYIEPGRFIAGPAVKLVAEIIQIYDRNIIINTTIYNCCLDSVLTGTKLLVEDELDDSKDGDYYLIKGNSPTRDDIFRYKVKLKNPCVGDKIVFLNAGAYNYTTDFFGYKKLRTEII